MLNITNRAKNVSPSLTLAITAKANKLKERGVDIVSFAAGEPDFNTPEFIVNAAKDALDKGLTKYTPASGIAPLKKAVCAKLKRDNALDYQPEQIVISTGAKQSLFNALQTVCQEGDEVIIISPYWLTYPELVKMAGAKPVLVPTLEQNGFKLTELVTCNRKEPDGGNTCRTAGTGRRKEPGREKNRTKQKTGKQKELGGFLDEKRGTCRLEVSLWGAGRSVVQGIFGG